MAFDADLDSTHNPATGGMPPAAWGDKINANFAELGGAWTAFTPTWTGAGGNPAIGNGVISGAYKLIGKTLYVRYYLSMGTTTTFGTGEWGLSLPAGLAGRASVVQTGTAFALDSGTAYRTGVVYLAGGGTSFMIVSHAGGNGWQSTVPHTWAVSDLIAVSLVIEVA